MRPTLSRVIRLMCNVVSALSLAVLVGLVSREYLIHGRPVLAQQDVQPADPGPAVGTRISIPDWDFAKAGTTVVMAMTTACQWSPDALDFYEELTRPNP